MGTWGGKDSSWTGVVDRFYVAFLCRIKFGVCFCCQHINAQMILFVLLFYFGITLVGIMPSYPECQPWTDAFLPPPSPLCYTCSQRANTQKGVFGVCNKQYVCVWVYYKRSLEKKQKESTTTTTNGELFSSSTFDLIIYFCVVEHFGFVQIWIFGLGGWTGCEGSRRIISLLPFRCSAPLTHTFNTQLIVYRIKHNPPPKCRQQLSVYLMMFMVVVTTTARSFLAISFVFF